MQFSVRPYHKNVQVEIRKHFRIQYKEQRYLIGVGFDEDLPLTSFAGIYLSGGAGYTFAYYEGTRRRPREEWTALLGAGLSLNWLWNAKVSGRARIGYRYADLPDSERSRLHVAIGASF